jgi:hypothetical protein
MKTVFRTLMACAVVAALAAPVAAQSSIAKPEARAAEDPLAKRVSLDLKAMAPADAFAALASSAGLKAVVDPAVTAPVDILVRNVTARTALTAMCESIGCTWTIAAGTLSIKTGGSRTAVDLRGYLVTSSSEQVNRIVELLKKPLPADMKFADASLDEVSARLSQVLGIKVALTTKDPGVKRITIDFGDKTLADGLRKLAATVDSTSQFRIGLTLDVDPDGKGPRKAVMFSFAPRVQEKKAP